MFEETSNFSTSQQNLQKTISQHECPCVGLNALFSLLLTLLKEMLGILKKEQGCWKEKGFHASILPGES